MYKWGSNSDEGQGLFSPIGWDCQWVHRPSPERVLLVTLGTEHLALCKWGVHHIKICLFKNLQSMCCISMDWRLCFVRVYKRNDSRCCCRWWSAGLQTSSVVAARRQVGQRNRLHVCRRQIKIYSRRCNTQVHISHSVHFIWFDILTHLPVVCCICKFGI